MGCEGSGAGPLLNTLFSILFLSLFIWLWKKKHHVIAKNMVFLRFSDYIFNSLLFVLFFSFTSLVLLEVGLHTAWTEWAPKLDIRVKETHNPSQGRSRPLCRSLMWLEERHSPVESYGYRRKVYVAVFDESKSHITLKIAISFESNAAVVEQCLMNRPKDMNVWL